MWSKKAIFLLLAFLASAAIAADVTVLSLRGPIGTAKISPANGSSTAYRMDFSGQSAICFQSAATTVVYLSSASAIGANGWGLYNKGESLCMDLMSGTTVYFYGAGASADVRAAMVK